ncbi:hypothetical protein SAMN04489740_1017 [Arthrobacter alpinus]|uniref:Uncharacterized protein n=1 Tax=Arthrobacter alpinus TaxID=656366 RepID=A0A1H5HI08_9MICC|nr:hypothetical protein SAMN04489740_1017 [Arthrobacter alpinus]
MIWATCLDTIHPQQVRKTLVRLLHPPMMHSPTDTDNQFMIITAMLETISTGAIETT